MERVLIKCSTIFPSKPDPKEPIIGITEAFLVEEHCMELISQEKIVFFLMFPPQSLHEMGRLFFFPQTDRFSFDLFCSFLCGDANQLVEIKSQLRQFAWVIMYGNAPVRGVLPVWAIVGEQAILAPRRRLQGCNLNLWDIPFLSHHFLFRILPSSQNFLLDYGRLNLRNASYPP